MKLVKILASELVEWPERSSGRERIAITQDGDGELNYCPMPNPKFDTAINQWLADGGVACDGTRAELADDYKTAIITREMWQAERDRIAQQKETAVKSPKANKDGWIRHRGGKCPVDIGTPVDIKLRNGDIAMNCKAMTEESDHEMYFASDWSHDNNRYDIMAWRPHKHDRSKIVDDLQSECEAVVSVSNSLSGPIQWRDRIREIDAATIALNDERASLLAKLQAEGFALIQCDEPNGEAESAQKDITQQDMSDPANWRVGDLFEITGKDSHKFPMGELVKLIVFEDDHEESEGHRYAYLDDSDFWWVRDCNVRFHSRPTA